MAVKSYEVWKFWDQF